MRIWFALLAAPVLALADQSIAYAMVGWACNHQETLVVHAVHVAFLVATVAGTLAAAQVYRASAASAGGGEPVARRRFLAGLATASAALSSLVIAAMWIPAWFLAPCAA